MGWCVIAAIGSGWATDAWVEAGWISGAWAAVVDIYGSGSTWLRSQYRRDRLLREDEDIVKFLDALMTADIL